MRVHWPVFRIVVAVSYVVASGSSSVHGQQPCDPHRLGLLSGSPYDVAVVGQVAYLAEDHDDYDGFVAVDVSDPGNLRVLGSVALDGRARGRGVVASSDYAYVIAETVWRVSGLHIIDVQDPANPHVISSIMTPGSTEDIAVTPHGLAYVADDWEGLQVIDVHDPMNPMLLGSVDTPGYAVGCAVAGDYVCVADLNHGLQIVDASDPLHPVIVGSLFTPSEAVCVTVVESTAYLGTLDELLVIDISDPHLPFIVGRLQTVHYAGDIAILDDVAYVADHYGGLRIVDVGNPAHPVIVGGMYSHGISVGVDISHRTVYLANRLQGFLTVDVSTCPPCLSLSVEHLVAGEEATFSISRGTPGARAVTVFGFRGGKSRVDHVAGLCATFGIEGINGSRVIGGTHRTFDENGQIQFSALVPHHASGVRLLFQAAAHGTCPDECTSNLVRQIVQ